MDHAGDVARRIQEGYARHPYGESGHDSVFEAKGDRERTSFLVGTSDGGVFRVTVEDLGGWGGATEEELHERQTISLEALLPPHLRKPSEPQPLTLAEWVEEGMKVMTEEDREEMTIDPEAVADAGSLLGAAAPLCGRCGGEHLAAECPQLRAGAEPIEPDAEGTR